MLCHAVLCHAVPQGGAAGDEIDLDKEEDKGKKPKRQRCERYEDDFIDDSEIERVKGGPKVKTLYSGFFINKVRQPAAAVAAAAVDVGVGVAVAAVAAVADASQPAEASCSTDCTPVGVW
jgi:hypothetical protein